MLLTSARTQLGAQSFSGNLLDRSDGSRRDAGFLQSAFAYSVTLLVQNTCVLVQHSTESHDHNKQIQPQPCWLAPEGLQQLGLQPWLDYNKSIKGIQVVIQIECKPHQNYSTFSVFHGPPNRLHRTVASCIASTVCSSWIHNADHPCRQLTRRVCMHRSNKGASASISPGT